MSDEFATVARYTMRRERCVCWGQAPLASVGADPRRQPARGPLNQTSTHRIWVAFLRLKNEEFQAEASLNSFCCLPTNKLTVWLTQRPWIHCQLVFWDNEQRLYYTFSVDGGRPVHVYERKSFQNGWDFIELLVSESCELRIYNFLVAQLGKSMNRSGQLMVLFFPVDSRGERWFCSELVAAALEAGGIVDFSEWDGISGPSGVVMHHLYDYLLQECKACPTKLLSANPVAISDMYKVLEQPTTRFAIRTEDGMFQSLRGAAAQATKK